MGNKRVVADSSRCIGCQTCMAACIEAHDIPGNIAAPRLRVTRTYEISAPVACHHCEDAPCAKACPTGALFFDPKNPLVLNFMTENGNNFVSLMNTCNNLAAGYNVVNG